jgi:hypothetical protein
MRWASIFSTACSRLLGDASIFLLCQVCCSNNGDCLLTLTGDLFHEIRVTSSLSNVIIYWRRMGVKNTE